MHHSTKSTHICAIICNESLWRKHFLFPSAVCLDNCLSLVCCCPACIRNSSFFCCHSCFYETIPLFYQGLVWARLIELIRLLRKVTLFIKHSCVFLAILWIKRQWLKRQSSSAWRSKDLLWHSNSQANACTWKRTDVQSVAKEEKLEGTGTKFFSSSSISL